MPFGQEAAYETWKDHRPQVPAAGHRAADCLPDGRYSVAAPVWPAALLHVGVSALWRADDRRQQPLSPKAPPLLADSAAERSSLRRLDPPAQPHAGPDLSASSGDSGAPVPLPPVPGIPLGRHACHGPPPPRGRGVHGPVWAVLSDRGLLRPSAAGPGAGSVGAAGAGSAGSGGDAHLRTQHHSGRFSLRAAPGPAGPSGPGRAGCGRLRSAAGRQGGADPHLSGRRQPSGGRPDRCIPVPDVSLPGPLRRVRRDVLRRRRRQ